LQTAFKLKKPDLPPSKIVNSTFPFHEWSFVESSAKYMLAKSSLSLSLPAPIVFIVTCYHEKAKIIAASTAVSNG